MNDELETLIMNSIDDIYKLNSSKIGEKNTSLDIRGVTKKEDCLLYTSDAADDW